MFAPRLLIQSLKNNSFGVHFYKDIVVSKFSKCDNRSDSENLKLFKMFKKKSTVTSNPINPSPSTDPTTAESNANASTKSNRKKFPKRNDPVFKNPDIFAAPEDIIKAHGFPCETHEVEGNDGYIITLFRIPYGKKLTENNPGTVTENNPGTVTENIPGTATPTTPTTIIDNESSSKRPVVLFAHGIATCGVSWILNDEENVLAYQLAERGFDCWILNARGSEYSRKHLTLKTNSRSYWNFSWHDMAEFDIPAIIDYVLKTADQEQLFYIGHSMGCAVLFAGASIHPELSSKIKLMIAYAPAVYVGHARTKAITVMANTPGAQGFISILHHGELWARNSIQMSTVLSPWLWMLRSRRVRDSTWMCWKGLNLVNGTDDETMNWSMLPVVAGHLPSPTSVRTFGHFLQSHKSREFRQYDFGRSKNIKKYGSPTPPSYDLTKSTFPVAIFYGDNDACIQPKDACRLADQLSNVVLLHRVDWPKFHHTSFMLGTNCNTLVNAHVIDLMSTYL